MKDTLEPIYEIASKFLRPLTAKDTFEAIIEEATKFTGADYGSIFIKSGNELRRIYTTVPIDIRITPRSRGYSYIAISKNEPFVLNRKLLKKAHPEANPKIKSMAIMPLSYKKRTTGTLTLIFVKKEFDMKKLKTLILFSSLATIVIRKAQLYHETKKALEARDLFISTAAHELKTPLTTITVYNELIYNRVMGGSMPEKKWVESLASQVYRLTKLINEFLQLDTLQLSDLRFEWNKINLKDVIGQSLRNFNIKYPQRKIEFDDELGEKNDVIRGDFDKLLQVINNLLDNAVKFSPHTSTITVSLSTNSPYLRIRVKDEGKGIGKKDLNNLFRKYYKGEVHGKPGMGIGLFLSKKIIDRHKGIINIYSALKKGTTVEILLPKK